VPNFNNKELNRLLIVTCPLLAQLALLLFLLGEQAGRRKQMSQKKRQGSGRSLTLVNSRVGSSPSYFFWQPSSSFLDHAFLSIKLQK
jgi:hypothetical protein